MSIGSNARCLGVPSPRRLAEQLPRRGGSCCGRSGERPRRTHWVLGFQGVIVFNKAPLGQVDRRRFGLNAQNHPQLIVQNVGAGASLQASLQQASEYTPMPLRAELAEMVARLRLGDSPADVFQLLGQRVPTETFRLISTTLTVNWRMGGELGHTLSAIGTTIRDRLAIARQLRTLSTQGAMTTITVLTVIWFMAAMMWQADPPRFVSFLLSTEGSWLIAACLVMQGLGIAMISRISRPKI